MNRRRFFILVFLLALAGAIGVVLWSNTPVEELSLENTSWEESSPGDERVSSRQQEHLGEQVVANERIAIEAPLVPRSGQMLRFVMPDSQRSPAVEATIGMAGMWPPAQANAPVDGLIPLPRTDVSTLWGDETDSYEVYASTLDRAHAFWGDVSIEDLSEPGVHDVDLTRASPLEVVVTDERDEPIADAEVRISRGFVALVHLSKQTGESGVAVFDALPGGEFQVTVQAKGFARRMRHLVHTHADKTIALSLVEGTTTIGNGELERLAKDVVISGNRTVVPTGAASGEDGGQEDEESAQRVRHPLDLYVVDRTGSAVQGALIQLWKDGRKLFEKQSAGRAPVRVEIATPFRGTLVAFDGQRGEGRIRIDLSGEANSSEFIVRLDQDLLTLDLPPGRINARGRIEQILGVELVRDHDAWLADVLSPSSAAAKAGIERGDRVVFVLEVPGGYSALIERGTQRMRVQIASEN